MARRRRFHRAPQSRRGVGRMSVLRAVALAGSTVLLLLVISARSTLAYPGDVVVTAGPVQGPNVVAQTQVRAGTWSVSSRTGAAEYSYPIALPPGRVDMQPFALGLTYSSLNPIRGDVAAGWSLGLPVIEIDTSEGILAGVHFKSSLAGDQRLVEVNEPGADPNVRTFRAEKGVENETRKIPDGTSKQAVTRREG
jgi:hypothetical protein